MGKWTHFAADRKRQMIILFAAAAALAALLSPRALARTYTITDGQRTVTYTTFATDPAEVLGGAGVSLSEEDTYFQRSTGIQVCRAMRVRLRLRGQEQTVVSTGETVEALLRRLGIELTPEDILSHDPEVFVWDAMELRIDRVTCREEVYTAAIPFEITYCSDPSLPMGCQEVLVVGCDGELLCRAAVTYTNSRETDRTVLEQTMTRRPVNRIIAVGTGTDPETPPQLQISDGFIRLPTGEVLTYSGSTQVRATAYTHTDEGCDYITYTGTRVRVGTVAVDPRYIPYGTRMFIVSNDGCYIYGISVAEDCGGAIKRDRIDLYFPTYNECIQFGRRDCTVYFLT